MDKTSLDTPPANPSAKLWEVILRIEGGFLEPNTFPADSTHEEKAADFQVTLWEYANIVEPLLSGERMSFHEKETYEALSNKWEPYVEKVLALPLAGAK
jgi:hypothetical protein